VEGEIIKAVNREIGKEMERKIKGLTVLSISFFLRLLCSIFRLVVLNIL
jgi:hypothetical protein